MKSKECSSVVFWHRREELEKDMIIRFNKEFRKNTLVDPDTNEIVAIMCKKCDIPTQVKSL